MAMNDVQTTSTRTPVQVVAAATEAGAKKAQLDVNQLLVRSTLSGLLVGISTSFAISVWTMPMGKELPLLGACVFPVSFCMLVILGLELITGNMCLIPMAIYARRASLQNMLRNWIYVFVGNFVGGLAYAIVFWIINSNFGEDNSSPIAQKTMEIAVGKTLGYVNKGAPGLVIAFLKAILCNWMVTMGVMMNFTSTSTLDRIIAMSMPVVMFITLGYEHAVVNFIVIPAGMMFGANITVWQWLFWNQLPVLLGNLIGGCFLTGIPLAYAYPVPAPAAEVSAKMELGCSLVDGKHGAVAGA